jgi:N-acetylglucosamine-6-phosphate deacetylase
MTPPPLDSIHGTILAPGGKLEPGVLHWDSDGTITRLEQHLPSGGYTFEAHGLLVCPGFINLHVHGGMGADTLDASAKSLAVMAQDQARQGVTAFLPTTASAPQEVLLEVCKATRDYMSMQAEGPLAGAHVLGLHLEGPYFSTEKAGAQNPKYFRDPDWEEYSALQRAAGGAVRLLSLAPERDPRGVFIEMLAAQEVVVAAGHTNASFETGLAAIRSGLSHATHVFNGMSRFNYRTPGILEALLLDDDVILELIPDCSEIPHVHPTVIRLLKRMVRVGRICAITDAISAAGMPDGDYRLGGLEVRKEAGVVFLGGPWLSNGERRLAGSVLAMNVGLRNLVEKAGFSPVEAVQTATANPARALGISEQKGSLAPGKHADIVVLHPETFEVAATFVRGQQVYGRG